MTPISQIDAKLFVLLAVRKEVNRIARRAEIVELCTALSLAIEPL
jgi:hypothetical protein